MGDMFSSKKTSTTQQTRNEQVAQSGRANVGRVGDNNQINITDASDVSIYAQRDTAIASVAGARDTALGALREMGQASVAAADSAMRSSEVTGAVASRSFDTADNALAVAEGVSNASHQSVIYTLNAMRDFQKDANETVSMAVQAAQDTALRAVPYSPGASAEISGEQEVDKTKYVLFALVAIAAIGAAVFLSRRTP